MKGHDQKTLEFLQKIKDSGNWNNDYDYSEIKYFSFHERVEVTNTITKSKHLVRPAVLLKNGFGCVMENAIDKNKFAINSYRLIHGDKYDYRNFDYKNATHLNKVICPEHGEFQISHNKHKSGRGCPKCGEIRKRSSRKITLKNVLEGFKKVHGDKYDYSEFIYSGKKSKSKIICPIHGAFFQTADIHERGAGCPKCAGKQLSSNDIIHQFLEVHGTRYDYSLVEYKNSKTPVKIICKLHGVFEQNPVSHKGGKNCPKCVGGVSKSWQEVLKEFKEVHGDKYDYSLVQYVSNHSPIKIICKTHGIFEQTPASHKSGKGCAKCSGKGLTHEEKINDFKQVHGDRYDYSKVQFKGHHRKVKIICKLHGVFEQTPSKHKGGKNCPKCVGGVSKSWQEVLKEFKEVHGDKYDYSLVQYVSNHSPIKIICKTHGIFEQTPASHKSGRGCFVCNKGWRQIDVVNFINDIKNQDVLSMDPVELNMLIAQGKLPKEFEELVFTLEGAGENSLKSLKEKLGIDQNTEKNEDELNRLSENLEQLNSSDRQEVNNALMAIEAPSIEDLELSSIEERENKNLPSISNEDILVLDKELINTCDDEAVEFFIQYKLKKVWNEVINNKRDVNDIKLLSGGKNSTRLKELFLDEYDKVVNYNPPVGYSFERGGKIAPPNMMQKLIVQRVKTYGRYGNWSGTGAGKTISFIIASREIEAKVTIVICLNSTVSQLEEDILEVYPDSLIHTNFRKGQKFDRGKHNYLLLNYEKFQQGYTEERFQDLNANNLIDFIVLDEIHNTKQRHKDESQRRGAVLRLIGRSAEMNPNFHLLGMSATPVINNLIEAKSLLQLITGKKYDDINTRGTITNALKIFNQLLLNGVRYMPKYNILLNELTGQNTERLNINGENLIEALKSNSSKDYLGLEKILLDPKLEAVKDYIRPKTIVYTYFTDDSKIPRKIAKYVQLKGYSVGFYIGEQSTEERELSKINFVKGKTDVFIASRTIGTGVDGLQNVCNRMIILTLPWTDSEYTQLKGRIYRQGSEFGDVEIIIPQVYIDLDNQRWSWDKQRLQLIRDKRTLADAAVDGIIPSKFIPSREKLCSDSLQALKKWKERVNEGKITIVQREDLILPLRPELIEQLRSSLGDFSELNKKWSISRSENTFNRLKKDSSEWFYYHSLYSEKRKSWKEIPYLKIAEKLNLRKEWVIADLGCGENLLAQEVENKIHAFDLNAIDDTVTECDISNVPLGNNTMDAVVFSLSLMGSNYIDYLKEGHRILKPYGNMFIAEPKKKWENKSDKLVNELNAIGLIVTKNYISDRFWYLDCYKN